MSVNGPSALGTLLVQRIDAMLGTSLAQQANVVSGARPDAVSQPTTAERGNPLNNDTLRDPREVVDRSRGQTEQQGRQGVERGTRLDAKTAELLLARQAANTSSTQSAPTRLGFAAQTILALLASFPEQQPVQGRRPLLNQSPGNPGGGEGAARAGQGGGQGAASAGGAGQGANAGAAQGASGSAQGGAQAAQGGGEGATRAGQGGGQGATSAGGAGQGANAGAAQGAAQGAGGSAQGGAQAAQGGAAGGNAGAASGAQGQGQAAGTAGSGGNAAAAAGSGTGSAAAGNAAGAGATTAGSQATQLAALARTPLPSLGGSAAAGGANALAGLQGSSALVGQLAQALSQSVQTSGMFYESHLGNLVFGRSSAQSVQQEPQAQMARGPGQSAAAPSGGAPAGAAPGAAAAAAGTAAGAAAGAAQAAAPAATPTAAQTTLTLSGIDPQTQPIVRQQLDVLASQTFAWKGELWPEAPMEWEVGRRDAWTELDGTEHPDHWATRLKVELPTLGEVEARLTLAGNQLVMHLVAPESANLLQHEVETLRGRFSALGLHLGQVSVASQASNEGGDNTAAAGMQAGAPPAAWQQAGAPGTEADNQPPTEAEHADDAYAGGNQR